MHAPKIIILIGLIATENENYYNYYLSDDILNCIYLIIHNTSFKNKL